jgi:predicted dehydrogenase
MATLIRSETRRNFLVAAGTTFLSARVLRGEGPPLAPPDKQPADLKLPEPVAKTVGWAVVGLGKLALEEVMPAFAKCKLSRPTALVSGHPDKAKKVAAAHGVDPKHIYDYATYDKIADDPLVQVIYIILPNSMHAEYTIRGLKAGKHVLCEKPMAATVKECEEMIETALAAKRKLMVAYRLRYEPFHTTAIELCRRRDLGKIKSITASNCQDVKAPNIRLSKQLAGGPVEDVGVYCLNAARYLTGEEPVEVSATAHQPKDDPRFREVAESVAFTLRFPSGVIANCDCSFGTAESRSLTVQGASGVLHMDNAFAYRGQKLFVTKENQKAELKLTPIDHFAAEMDAFSENVLNDRDPLTPGADGLADMKVIAAITKAAETGQRVSLK